MSRRPGKKQAERTSSLVHTGWLVPSQASCDQLRKVRQKSRYRSTEKACSALVEPSSRPGFHGPVVLLTGLLTISAGETFTQALMGRTPHITRIGENTQGVFSDVLDRKLPNGWGFGLPNEVFRTQEGKTFDVDGIPPDVNVPIFADADVAAGTDPAMARALELLRQAISSKR